MACMNVYTSKLILRCGVLKPVQSHVLHVLLVSLHEARVLSCCSPCSARAASCTACWASSLLRPALQTWPPSCVMISVKLGRLRGTACQQSCGPGHQETATSAGSRYQSLHSSCRPLPPAPPQKSTSPELHPYPPLHRSPPLWQLA